MFKRVLLCLVFLFLGSFLVLTVLHQLSPKSAPPPLWTEADLPALPREEENGFSLILKEEKSFLDTQKIDAVLKDITWEKLLSSQGALSQELQSPALQEKLALFKRALSFPRFADSCPARFDASCPSMLVLRLHKLAEADLLLNAAQGNWGEATLTLQNLLRADLDFLSSSRRFISTAIALSNTLQSLRIASMLVEASNGDSALKSSLATSIAPASVEKVSVTNSLITEYVSSYQVIEGFPNASSWIERLYFDKAQTVELLNTYFQEARQFASSPKTQAAPVPPLSGKQGVTHWLYNPTGKLLLETLLIELEVLILNVEEKKVELSVALQDLKARL